MSRWPSYSPPRSALVLVALGRRAWHAVGEIEQALAEADAELAYRD